MLQLMVLHINHRKFIKSIIYTLRQGKTFILNNSENILSEIKMKMILVRCYSMDGLDMSIINSKNYYNSFFYITKSFLHYAL